MTELSKINPIEKTDKPEAQIEAEKTAEGLASRFTKEGFDIIEDLLKEIEDAKLAKRFKTEVDVDMVRNKIKPAILSYQSKEAMRKESEVGYKKTQLSSDVRKIQTELLTLAERLKNVVMDIKASKTE